MQDFTETPHFYVFKTERVGMIIKGRLAERPASKKEGMIK